MNVNWQAVLFQKKKNWQAVHICERKLASSSYIYKLSKVDYPFVSKNFLKLIN